MEMNTSPADSERRNAPVTQIHCTYIRVFPSLTGVQGIISRLPAPKADHIYGAPLCPWGKCPGHASWFGVFSLFPLPTLFTLVGEPSFGAKAVSDFSFLWLHNSMEAG